MSDTRIKVTQTDLYNQITDTDKIKFILYDYNNIDNLTIADHLSYSPIGPISPISPINKFEDKKDKKDRRTADLKMFIRDKLNKYLQRLINRNEIIRDESKKPYVYSLTQIGKNFVETRYKDYMFNLELIESAERRKNEPQEIINAFKEYFLQDEIFADIAENCRKGHDFYIIDFKHLLECDFDLIEHLSDNTLEVLAMAKIAILSLDITENENFQIYLSNVPDSYRVKITKLRNTHIGKLTVVIGEISSRSQSSLQIVSSRFECPSCGNIIPILQMEETLSEPSRCGCGRKGKFRQISCEVIDTLRLTIRDLYEELESNEVAEEINVLIKHDHYGFEKFAEGERVRIYCVPFHTHLHSKNKKTVILQKVLDCKGIEKLEEDYTKILITEQDEQQFQEILKNPLKWHQETLFHDLHDVDLPSIIGILSIYGNLNILNLGMPGNGKSEIMKRICKISIKGKFTNATTNSGAGVIGTITQNPFTGKYSLDGGALRSMHPYGKVGIDEINRDKHFEVQDKLLGVMNDKRLIINKAAKIDVPCDVSILATANPLGTYCDHRHEHQNWGISGALWDRFDVKVYFSNVLDHNNYELVAKLMNAKKKDWVIRDNKLRILKKYQIKSQLIDVELTKEDSKKLCSIIQLYYSKIDHNASYRVLSLMSRFLKAICKLNLRDHTVKDDFVLMSDLFLELNLAKKMFVSQQNQTENNINNNETEVIELR